MALVFRVWYKVGIKQGKFKGFAVYVNNLQTLVIIVVPKTGIEPVRSLGARDFKSLVYAPLLPVFARKVKIKHTIYKYCIKLFSLVFYDFP
jgi:hypothetical protein